MQLDEAIEIAKNRTGSYKKLAEAIGMRAQGLNALKNGARKWPAEHVDAIGEIAGLSIEERARLVWETVRKNAGKGLHSALLGAVAMLYFGASDRAQAAAAPDDLNHAYV